jgi:hypothetical protein
MSNACGASATLWCTRKDAEEHEAAPAPPFVSMVSSWDHPPHRTASGHRLHASPANPVHERGHLYLAGVRLAPWRDAAGIRFSETRTSLAPGPRPGATLLRLRLRRSNEGMPQLGPMTGSELRRAVGARKAAAASLVA